jgi:hypothetical protein
MKLFLQVMKDAGVSSVHVTSAIGNTKKKPTTFKDVMSEGDDEDDLAKSWTLPMEIKKIDPDKRLIFGWASVVEKDGKMVVDKQGDIIPVEELETAAYQFTLDSRDHGDMHKQVGTGRLVESMVFSHEKQQALGINLGQVGWWVGFHVHDDDLWSKHKRGDRPEFSIGGAAIPVEVE